MSNVESLMHNFPAASVNGGHGLLQQGRVHITHMTAQLLRASVQEKQTVSVEIESFGGGDFDLACGCSYFHEQGDPCKHICATLLMGQRRGWAPLNSDFDSQAMRIFDSIPALKQLFSASPRKVPSKSKPKPQPEAWKQALRQLKDSMQYGVVHTPAPVWPAGREIVYVIDISPHPYRIHGEKTEIVVDIYTCQPRKDGTPGKPKAATLSGWEWMTAPDAADRNIGQLLLGAQANGVYNNSSRQFIVPGWAHETTLQAICRTGRCMLRTEPPPADMHPLRWDATS